MPTEGNVVQLHKYPAFVLEKEQHRLTLVWCEPTGKVVDGISTTIPTMPFLHEDINVVYAKLLEAGWKVAERYDNVEVT